ncbi:zinc-binding dehydrogenase [Faecalicoccus pleomorphus]|uniref:zinc-binding dehydrogenase n=1 Tax=Faecalicoccus pleomorphus TaxID=1323 RepID=UPI001E436E03|nr:zinc-binding dehydrogenase [Faecalicoccus pleomorphus]MDB7983855.1 alcohol dehydrogenase catalytic domain-containing protein [Faecalicoccus pleomorphus]
MTTMKAALMYGPNDIRIEQVKKPICPNDGILLKIMAVGLCGSDIRNLTSDSRKGQYPFIYGHEIVGCVEEIGAKQTKYKVGQRLLLFPGTYCMECDNCISGHSENCENEHVSNLAGTGGFAQYIAISGEKIHYGGIYEIPDGVSYETASLAEPLTSVYACLENAKVGFPDTIVIIGAGPIGDFMAQISKIRGAKKVIMIDLNAHRLEMAKQFGVDNIILSNPEKSQEVIQKVLALTNGKGADKVISATPCNATQAQALYMVKKGGLVVFFGGVPKGSKTELDTNLIHYNNIWIKGHFGASYDQSKRAFELATSKDFPSNRFITHILPLDEINKGIELTKTGEAIKVVLHPWD